MKNIIELLRKMHQNMVLLIPNTIDDLGAIEFNIEADVPDQLNIIFDGSVIQSFNIEYIDTNFEVFERRVEEVVDKIIQENKIFED